VPRAESFQAEAGYGLSAEVKAIEAGDVILMSGDLLRPAGGPMQRSVVLAAAAGAALFRHLPAA
jgi:hypothetical protein